MKKRIQYLLERLREPSTWAGIAALGALSHVDPTLIYNVGVVGPVVAALLGVFLPEQREAA
ncbi:hypothetical protein R6242_10740 [Iodobacter sp. CM08]|uniref:hypothetical protein n=1 Tax=Iodobacter sp. CM08 TaxID=3085902 RepID=UPI002981CE44|nr:hypothetical protein [Iodobacter sp. CM08]MDW5417041.1 hypothetical protein [Iodobacter sp. CM08]